MNLTNLKLLARAYVPQAKLSAIGDATLVLILNEGSLDVGLKGNVIKTNSKFLVTAEQQEYELRLVAPRYLAIDKPGVYWYSGSNWKKLYPKTLEWLDENIQNWRDASSGEPLYYYIHSDIVGFYPKPATTLASGAWIYYVKRPVPMPNTSPASEYPFEESTEMSQYAAYSDSVLDYWIWRAKRILNFPLQEVNEAKQAYMQGIMEKVLQLNKRIDVSFDKAAKFQGVRIP